MIGINFVNILSSTTKGWILEELVTTNIEFALCQPLNGRCGFTVVKSLKDARRVRGLISRNNLDTSRCFYLAIAHHYDGSTDIDRLNRYVDEHFEITGRDGMDVKDIKKFMDWHPQIQARINVLYQEGESLYPIFVS